MTSNKLSINFNKSNMIIYGRSKNYYPWLTTLNASPSQISRKSTVKYLGVILDETLSFVEHIQCASSKVARNVGMMRKLKHFFPVRILRFIYFSLVHPYLLYCCSVWLSTFIAHLRQLSVLQNGIIRILSNNDSRSSTRDLY